MIIDFRKQKEGTFTQSHLITLAEQGNLTLYEKRIFFAIIDYIRTLKQIYKFLEATDENIKGIQDFHNKIQNLKTINESQKKTLNYILEKAQVDENLTVQGDLFAKIPKIQFTGDIKTEEGQYYQAFSLLFNEYFAEHPDKFNPEHLGFTIVPIKLSNLGRIDKYSRLEKAFKLLQKQVITIRGKEVTTLINLAMKTVIYRKSGMAYILVDFGLYHTINNIFERGYSIVKFRIATQLRSFYSIRIYELLCMFRKQPSFFYALDKLREYLQIKTKFKQIADVKNKILNVAMRHLKDVGSDLLFTYETKKNGRFVVGFAFKIIKNYVEDSDIKNVTMGLGWYEIREEIKELKSWAGFTDRELKNPKNKKLLLFFEDKKIRFISHLKGKKKAIQEAKNPKGYIIHLLQKYAKKQGYMTNEAQKIKDNQREWNKKGTKIQKSFLEGWAKKLKTTPQIIRITLGTQNLEPATQKAEKFLQDYLKNRRRKIR